MTAYFDDYRRQVDALEASWRPSGEDSDAAVLAELRLHSIDKAIVWDVSLCTEQPAFPPDLRESIHRAILKFSPAGQPRRGSTLDYETTDDHFSLVRSLVEALHDQFHSLGRRGLQNFTDDPRTPLWELAANAEEFRERIALDVVTVHA